MTPQLPVVGIAGAYGATGTAVTRELFNQGSLRLRIGGRRLTEARKLAGALNGPVEAVAVDVADSDDLASFCEGCRVVVNCTGPSCRLADRVARAAFAAGADYIDVGGYDMVYGQLADLNLGVTGRRAILSAGVVPGLSGLLPRYLASRHGSGQPRRLLCYFGGLDHLSPAAATDVLASLRDGSGESLAVWKDGGRTAHAASPLTDVELPLFPEPVSTMPYLSTEAQRLARDLGVQELCWYNVYPGTQTLGTLNRIQALGAALDQELASMPGELVRSASIDLAGRTPFVVALVQLDGETNGGPVTSSLLLRSTQPTDLGGQVAALATSSLLNGELSPGVYHAGEVLSPETVYAALRRSLLVDVLTIVEEPIEGSALYDEGAL